jgi:hypothetical protein
MQDSERIISVEICGKKYDLLLTVGVTKALIQRFGNLDEVPEKLKDPNEAVDAAVFLLVELINGATERQNVLSCNAPSPLITERDVCALISPADFPEYSKVIMDAINAGMHRNVESEDSLKNVPAAP